MRKFKILGLLLITMFSGLFLAQKSISISAATPAEYSVFVGIYNVSDNSLDQVISSNLVFIESGGYYYVQHTNSTYNTTVGTKPSVNWHQLLGSGVTSSKYLKIQVGNSMWPESNPINVNFHFAFQFGVQKVSGSDNDMSLVIKQQTSTMMQYTVAYSGIAFTQNTVPATATNFNLMNVSIEILKPDMVPVLEGEVAYITNIDDPISEESIRSNLVAWDDEDGDISHLITVTADDYTPNMDQVGEFEIEYSVTDSSGNTSILIVNVLIRDITRPVISGGSGSYSIGYKETLNLDTIKSSLTASDNYDSTVPITIKTNNYTANKGTIGQYQVVYSAIDSSGNEGTKSILVNVIDNVAPVFSGPTSISKPKNQVLTESQIRSQLSAMDEISGNRTANIQLVTDDYTGKGALVGTYSLVYAVSDAAGNQTQHTVQVTVVDDVAPWWFMRDGYFISVPDTVNLTRQQIIDILVQTSQLTVGATTYVSFLVDEYSGNESEPGIYAMTIKTTSVSGTESVKNLAIQVTSGTGTDGDLQLNPALTHWQSYWPMYLGGLGLLLLTLFILAIVYRPRKRYKKRFR